jgi:DNA-binding transcriptional MerR regulator
VKSERALRIGQVAERTGTTPRTNRYYEEIGLLPRAPGREPGSHRLYEENDVERLRELLSLKDLLGISLDELRELAAAESAREAIGHIERQLELIRRRRKELERLEDELIAKRRRARSRLRSIH